MPGLHFILDGFEAGNSELMSDIAALTQWMDALPEKIGMRILLPTVVKRIAYPKCSQGWEGISGFTLIYESHISVHTFPTMKEIHADVFSCKAFDAEAVAREFVRDFRLGRITPLVFNRSIGDGLKVCGDKL
jgi:S-adenosylmethionine decarboxylase